MTTPFTPLKVYARLATGIAHTTPWGIALDSLLAAEIWARHKHQFRADNQVPPDLHDPTQPPLELDLPLARCAIAGDDLWHWAATTSYPVGTPPGLPPDVRMWSGRVDQMAMTTLADTLPATISDRQGRYRSRRMPLLVTLCTAVTWSCVGEPDAIRELLSSISAIGKKRSHGEGQVLAWEVEPSPEVDPWTAGHLHAGTHALGRPTPTPCLTDRTVDHGGLGTAGLRPPYMHAARQRDLLLPINIHHQRGGS